MKPAPRGVVDRRAWWQVQDLDDRGKHLTKFEQEFVRSVRKTLLDGGRLTERQVAKIEQIREVRL